jgi:beta-galactosidase
MKNENGFLILLAACAALICGNSVQAAETASSPRQTINFNREWKFQLGDHAGADAVAFDDAQWDDIGLPHSFSMPYFASPKFYTGYGWYRKHFAVPADWTGKKLFLEFDGAFQDAEIFLNGSRVAEHKGGYTGFSLDITDAAKTGDNVVTVRLNNNWDAQLAPRAGEHVFSGGIYRDVRLVVTAPLHVTWYGTFVTTPQVSAEAGTVNVKTEIRNDDATAKACVVLTDILDPNGKKVASISSTQSVAAGTTVTFDQTTKPIASPKLWHPDHPFLYTAVSKVFDGKQAADNFTTPFGFRWFKWTADQGFFLNGEHLYIKGADVHQDHAGWGDAVADSGFFRDVNLVKEAGFDFIRGSHYPHDPAFADACDQLGILFWSENCFWGMGGRAPDGYWNASAYPTNSADDAAFEASVRDSLRAMIRINRNHPSIVAWSMCNEVFFSDKSVLPQVRTFLTNLVALTHELDSTRPAGIGGCQRAGLDKLGDIAGYNGDGARLYINPGIPNLITEYSSVRAVRPGIYGPAWGNLVQGPGDKTQPYFWRYPWRSGEVLWCMFDHGSIAGDEGRDGIVDYFRLPKRAWFWYRNEYAHVPPPKWPTGGTPVALKLSADKTTLKSADGTDDAQIIVTVVDADGKALSNSPPVTLTIESGPGEFPTGPSIAFAPNSDIAIRDGEAAMEFRSYNSGKTVIRATSPGLKDATFAITTRGEPKFIAGKTPLVKPHPYVRFTGSTTVVSTPPASSIFGLNNPTLASSEATGHSANLGNEGNAATSWQPPDNDINPWWQVDLERAVTMTQAKITFPAPGNYRYKIETSSDGQHWTLVADQTQTTSTDQTRTDVFAEATSGHLLRVTFAGKPAAIAELEISGRLTAQ